MSQVPSPLSLLARIGQRTPIITGLAAFSLLSGILGVTLGLASAVNVPFLSLPLDVMLRGLIIGMAAAAIGIGQLTVSALLLRMDRSAWTAAVVVNLISLAYGPSALPATIHIVVRGLLGNTLSNAIFSGLIIYQFTFATFASVIVLELITRAPQRIAFGRLRAIDFIP